MLALLIRGGLLAFGAFVLFANVQGPEGTVLGFYPPISAQMIGYDLTHLAVIALAGWMIYRGIWPKHGPVA